MLRYAEIKLCDWLKIVIVRGIANQTALIQLSVALLL